MTLNCCAQTSDYAEKDMSNSDSGSDESEPKMEEIESKEFVQKQIKKLSKMKAYACPPIDEESDYPYSDDNREEMVIPNLF